MSEIRLAGEGDIGVCADLYERIGRAHFTWKPEETFKAGDFAAIAAEEDVWLFPATAGIAGFLTYYVPEHFVHLLFVDAARRGQGIGRQMLAHVRAHYGAPHSLKVNAMNGPARAFYKRLGYRALDQGGKGIERWHRLTSS